MPKTSASKPAARRGKRRDAKPSQVLVSKARFKAVMQAAQRSGLLGEKSGRIGGRVSPALIKQAKRQTGIEADTDLIEFALATVALEGQLRGDVQSYPAFEGRITYPTPVSRHPKPLLVLAFNRNGSTA